MKTYTVNYDLRQPGRNYASLIEAIKKLSPYWSKPLESCFVIVSASTAAQIRDSLLPHIDSNDKLLVLQGGPDWASWNIDNKVADWIEQHAA